MILPLRGYDHLGRMVFIGRYGAYNPEKVDIDDLFKATLMIGDVLLEEDEQATVTGSVMVFDFLGMTMAHMVCYTPAVVKKSMVLWQVRATFSLQLFYS